MSFSPIILALASSVILCPLPSCADGKTPSAAESFAAALARHAAEWDADGDGSVTLSELDRAIASAGTRGTDAAAAVAARLSMVRAKSVQLPLADAEKMPGAEKTFAWAVKRLNAAPRALYAKEQPTPESVRQGKLGDCFCLAGLRAVLHRDPAALAGIIQPQPDGSYRVRIGTTEIAVPAPTDGEIILGASAEDGLWPIVYEKAVGLFRTKPAESQTRTPFSVVTTGGSAGAMMAKLTGHPITRWSCKPWRDAAPAPEKQAALLHELRVQLQSAFAEKRLVTTGTGTKPTTGAVPGITYSHGYAVLGYDTARDELRLWNPHGNSFTPKGAPGMASGYPRTRGEFPVPLAEAVTFLAGFAFEQFPAARPTPDKDAPAAALETTPQASELGKPPGL